MSAASDEPPSLPAPHLPREPIDPSLLHRLQGGARQLGIDLDPRQMDQCRVYLSLLLEWSQRFNLTAITDPEAIIDKHFLDALTCATVLDLNAARRLVDVGTGAGFPGLVLKIAFPHLRVLLLDSVEKRLRFLQRVSEALRLEGVEPVHARAEDAGRDRRWREQFDVAVARAVARLSTLAEYCLPLVRVGGQFLAQKGPDVAAEVTEARPALTKLGGGAARVTSFTLPGTDVGRSLVLVPKLAPTPRDLPRLPGTPKKHPL